MRTQHSQKHSTGTNIRLKTRHYETDFKKKVAMFAEHKGNQEAKRRFGVSESNIRRWKKIFKEHVGEKVAVQNTVSNKNSKRKVTAIEDVPNKLDSMPLEQRLKSPAIPSTSEQEQILHSHPLSPTKLKVTRQTKPKEPSPKPMSPPPVEEMCLKWNSHHGNMQSMFPALLLKEQFVDATLVAEGQTLKCHRMILSSCSPYFEDVLSSISPYQHPVLFMKDTPFWVLKCLCDFMYTGEVLISQDKLNELLFAAENLKIKGLAGKPDVPNEELHREPLGKHIKEEKKDEPVVERESEKKDTTKDKKRHQYALTTIPIVVPEASTPKNAKLPKSNIFTEPSIKTSKIPKLNTYNDSPFLKSCSKVPKANAQYTELFPPKTTLSKVLRSSGTLKRIERSDKLLIKEAISKGDILDPFDLLEPVYEEVQMEPKPASIPCKAKETNKSVSVKKSVQKKVKKRKISDDRDESPPPVLSRKGTRSRPNKKIPRFYHSGFDNSTPKIQEPQESTIVREPHTSHAESQVPSNGVPTELHSDSTEANLDQAESHMDQADPLFQLEDIKAEPYDLEDSTIEIEDSVVNFSEPDVSMTEEDLLEETFEPVINFEEKSILKKQSEAKPFKKIRVTRQQVLLDVQKANIVKIVDVDKIKVSADIVEEDPLNLSSNLDSNIKIMNVESVTEGKDKTLSSEVGFKLCDSDRHPGETRETEENALGFQIASVISEVEEQKGESHPEESILTTPVCQIVEVFSETEDETTRKEVNDRIEEDVKDAPEKLSSDEQNSEEILESSTEKTEDIIGKDSCSVENDSNCKIKLNETNLRNEDVQEAFKGFDVPNTPEDLIDSPKEEDVENFTIFDTVTNADVVLPNTSDAIRAVHNLKHVEDDLRESSEDLVGNAKRLPVTKIDSYEEAENLNEPTGDRETYTFQLVGTSEQMGKTVKLEKTLEDLEKVINVPITNKLSITDVREPTVDGPGKAAEELIGTSEHLAKSVEDLSKIVDDSCETAEYLIKTATGDLDESANDPLETAADVGNSSKNPEPTNYLGSYADESQNDQKILCSVPVQDTSTGVIFSSELNNIKGRIDQIESANETLESNTSFVLKPHISVNSIEPNSCIEETFNQAIVTELSNNQDIDMTDESRTKDPVLANAVPYMNEDLPAASTTNEDLPMEISEESFSEEAPPFDQTPNSFELVSDVAHNDSSAYSAPGFHIAQVISEQIALNEECRLTNQPMDTSDTGFEGSVTSSNELEMIVNDLTKIVGESQRLESNMEHEDIAETLENLLEK